MQIFHAFNLSMQQNNSSSHYCVYICTVDGVVKYVGMGKCGRESHCFSGKSSCPELNRDFFFGKNIVVQKYFENLTKEDALLKEHELITAIGKDNLYNRNEGNKPKNIHPVTKRMIGFLDDFQSELGKEINSSKLLLVIKKLSKQYQHPIKGLTDFKSLTKLMEKLGYKYKNGIFTHTEQTCLHSLKAEYILLLS